MHQVSDLPHQRLVAIDHGLGGAAIVVEAGRGHLRLGVAEGLFAFGDARFEGVDARSTCLLGAGDLSGFGFCALLPFA
jgi:hypothetical protein